MGLTQEIGKIWNTELGRREETNSTWVRFAVERDTGKIHSKNRIAAILSRFVKAGCAKKGSTKKSWKKIKNYKPRRVIPKLDKDGLLLTIPIEKKKEIIEPLITEPTVDLLTLGQSILAIIDDFKDKITELRLQLSEEKETVRELIEQKRQLEELYKKAQTKIIELNSGTRAKSFNLGDLQNFRDELPVSKLPVSKNLTR